MSKHRTPFELLQLEVTSNPPPLPASFLASFRARFQRNLASKTRFRYRSLQREFTMDMSREVYISFLAPFGEVSHDKGRVLHKFRLPEQLDACPLLAGLPLIINETNPAPHRRKEINRVLYLSEKVEKLQKFGAGCTTVTAMFHIKCETLVFRFWTSHEHANHLLSFDLPLIGYIPKKDVDPTTFPIIPERSTVPFQVTTTVPAPPPILPPIPDQFTPEMRERHWNQLSISAKSLGFYKNDLEYLATVAKNHGNNIEPVNQLISSSLYNFQLKKTLKRKLDDSDDANEYQPPGKR